MLRIGLTGGIGSGKTTVARIFELLGVPVYYADEAAKEIMNTDEALKKQIMEAFGEQSYTGGQLNRAYISAIVFNDKDKLAFLNSMVHPATIRANKTWMQQQNTPFAIKEAALIFESGSGGDLDFIIGVYAPKALRIHRTMQRDNVSREKVMQRMSNQINEEIKMRLCDFVINNNDQQLIIPQVLELDKILRRKAGLN